MGIRKSIAIDAIVPNVSQPRQHFDEDSLAKLAASLKARGLHEEILVRPREDVYEIVHGERRWRAAEIAGWTEIPVQVEDMDDQEAFEHSLIKNVQKESLSPLEEGLAFRHWVTRTRGSREMLGGKVGRTPCYVSQKIRLLDLPITVWPLFLYDNLTEGHGHELLRLEGFLNRLVAPWSPPFPADEVRYSVIYREGKFPIVFPSFSERPDLVYPFFRRTESRAAATRQLREKLHLQIIGRTEEHVTELVSGDRADFDRMTS